MKQPFDAWHLPGLEDADLAFEVHEMGGLSVRAPALSVAQLETVIAHITAARASTLRQTPMTTIIEAIDRTAANVVTDPDTGSLVAAATGYSPETVADVLRHMVRDWGRASVRELVTAELGSIDALDAPRPDTGPGFLAGPGLAFHVFAGNVPGVAVTSLIRSLLVKAATLGKTASGEPVLPVLFARALAAVAPDLGRCVAVTYWPGGSATLEAAALAAADTVVVYGAAETVAAIRSRLPAGGKLVEHGPKLSLGVVGPNATVADAASIARAVAAYDQQGCVSPHAVYVEAGGVDPVELAAAIARELEALSESLPGRRLEAAEAIAIRAARDRAEFRSIAGDAHRMFGASDLSCTVIYDEDATLEASCLNRTLYVKPIANIVALCGLLAPHRNLMQSVALAGYDDDVIAAIALHLADVGVTRVTTFEQLPWPSMTWHHDGRGPLLELLNRVDIER